MKTIKILTLLTLLTVGAMAQKEALIVGVSDYKGTKYDLAGVKKDVVHMESLLKSWGFHVTILRDGESMSLENRLKSFSSLSSNDDFIFYYSGHGYHTRDLNGDEDDGEDEALVLTNGEKDVLFLDDTLNGYFNMIKAKKLLLFDSCHSGTVFKAFGKGIKLKTITGDQVDYVMKTKAFRPQESKMSRGEYIVLSASQDKEESLDTTNGGLFTNSFIREMQNGGTSKRLSNLIPSLNRMIQDFCKRSDSTPHHPKLSASSNKLKYTTLRDFFKIKTAPTPPKKTISILSKKTFRENELLTFKIDTHGESGYLTIFSIENGEPFIMAQTAKKVSGVLNFQEDFNLKTPIECYKSCTNCQQEKSMVYVIFSDKPMSKSLMMRKGLKIENSNSSNMKAFRERTHNAFEPVLAKFEITIY